jgi:hypothetical protein
VSLAEKQLLDRWNAKADGESGDPLRLTPDLAARVVLVAVFVVACYQFDWRLLRSITSECILRFSQLLGIAMQRVTSDTVQWNGMQFQFTPSCTQIDVFFGSIPLIWNLSVPAWKNVSKLGAYFLCLFAFNILRLELGYVLYGWGTPWVIAHECIAGVSLFLIFLWLMRQRRFQARSAISNTMRG